jgi:SRSO17 transposase
MPVTHPPRTSPLAQIGDWYDDLAALHAQIAPHFARPEGRDRVGRYLVGLLGSVERRNGWHLAEQMGEASPDGVQRLLRTARWDVDVVRDELRTYVVTHLGHPDAVLVIDETGFLKKGTKSVGVARQYSGTAGRIENCQIGVFLAYAAPRGRAFLDRALYLPKAWAADHGRRQAVGVPPAVSFATKPALAQTMLARAFAAEVPAAWVTVDSVYGSDSKLRRWLEAEHRPYVLAVTGAHHIWDRGIQRRVDAVVAACSEDVWQRLTVGAGSKGPRVFDWARARLPYDSERGFGQWVLIRRSVSEPDALAYYRVFGPTTTTLAEMARIASTRWVIEEGFERAKGGVGLDQYEVRTWAGWHRHITLGLLAHAFLEVTRAVTNGGTTKGGVSGI